jgi:hypothetical protein
MVKKIRINENVPHRMTVSQISLQQARKGLNAECTLFLEAIWKRKKKTLVIGPLDLWKTEAQSFKM